MAKKKKDICIDVVGLNKLDVSGSMSYVRIGEYNLLIEAGLFQSKDVLEQYTVNARNLPFKVKDLDFIIVGHVHADHSLLIPRLVREGFSGKIIMPVGSSGLFKILAEDSAGIVERDGDFLRQKYKRSFKVLYDKQDVERTMSLIEEYPLGYDVYLGEDLVLNFLGAGHILCSAQVLLKYKQGVNTKKILFTSDLGNPRIERLWVTNFDRLDSADVVIGECTYGASPKVAGTLQRDKDLARLKNVIDSCSGVCLMPLFALDRVPIILNELYKLYGKDASFKRKVILDSPLAIRLLEEYRNISMQCGNTEWVERLNTILNWSNLELINDSKVSQGMRDSSQFKTARPIVLASSGMLCKGRAYFWAQTLLEDSSASIILSGYAVEGSLAALLKKNKGSKVPIAVGNRKYKIKASVIELCSFSGHASRADLIDYYSTIKVPKVYLVHGSTEARFGLIEAYEKAASKCKDPSKFSAKLIAVDASTKIRL